MIYLLKPQDFTPKFEVVSCTVEFEDKFLVLQTGKHKFLRTKWGVPAGKVENNENLHHAIIRETFEETGINILRDNMHYFDTVFVVHEGYSFIYHMFYTSLDKLPSVQITSEHEQFRWVTPHEALNLDLIPDEDYCIKMYYRI